MKELDVVRLTKEFEGLAIGTSGAIVLEYDGKFFEVEFFDDDGNTIDVLTTPADCIELERKLGLVSHIARKLLEIHQVFQGVFIQSNEKSVCAICIPDLISTFLDLIHNVIDCMNVCFKKAYPRINIQRERYGFSAFLTGASHVNRRFFVILICNSWCFSRCPHVSVRQLRPFCGVLPQSRLNLTRDTILEYPAW